tara:strand:- start:1849 stop:2787 length:939 start_codon:yes stop_codon:yes gene_type:complete
MWFEFYKFLSGALIITGGYFLGCTIVSMWVYKEQKQIAAELTEEEKQEQSIKEYVDRYLEDYKLTERELLDEETIKKLNNITITETTPLGVVKMYYSHEDESFIYWSEKQVSYKVLESVSRKYVIDNDCKCIHYDMDEEIENKRQELLEATEAEKKNATTSTPADSVFVTFKKVTKPAKKKQIFCDNANRYSYRGKYEEPIVKESTNPEKNKALNFAEYLKMKEQNKGTYTLNGETCNSREELQMKVKELIQDEQDHKCILECELDERRTPSTDDLSAFESRTPEALEAPEAVPEAPEAPEAEDQKKGSWLW